MLGSSQMNLILSCSPHLQHRGIVPEPWCSQPFVSLGLAQLWDLSKSSSMGITMPSLREGHWILSSLHKEEVLWNPAHCICIIHCFFMVVFEL